jgi:hypothetical protein
MKPTLDYPRVQEPKQGCTRHVSTAVTFLLVVATRRVGCREFVFCSRQERFLFPQVVYKVTTDCEPTVTIRDVADLQLLL